MKAVIQRVTFSEVSVEGKVVGKIEKGLNVLLGVVKGDTENEVLMLADKICKMRIFSDLDGKTNLSIEDVKGSMLIISQFTLCADIRRGNRPDFLDSAERNEAERLYLLFAEKVKERGIPVSCGVFGADMKVEIQNDGPFTIIADTNDLKKSRKDK